MSEESYEEQIPRQLKDRASWPDFERADFLSELDGVADDALSRKTVDGYLAANASDPVPVYGAARAD